MSQLRIQIAEIGAAADSCFKKVFVAKAMLCRVKIRKAVPLFGEALNYSAFAALHPGKTAFVVFASAFVAVNWPMSACIISNIILRPFDENPPYLFTNLYSLSRRTFAFRDLFSQKQAGSNLQSKFLQRHFASLV